MIYQHEIDCLTDEEKGVLIYALNEVFRTSVKVDLGTVKAYKRGPLKAKLRAAKKAVNSRGIEVFTSMCRKLGVDV